MRSESRNEVISVEALLKYLVEDKKALAHTVLQEAVGQLEVVFIIEHVKVLYYTLIRHMSVGEAHHLVEDRQGIAHTTVGLLRYHVQSFGFSLDILTCSHMLQVLYYICHADSAEVVNLTSAQNSRKNLMLLGSGKDEDGMGGRLFKRLKESVERRSRKHVHLVDDVHLILSHLRRYAHLLYQTTDVFYRVVRCGIKLVYIIRALLIERTARLALVASLAVGQRTQAVDSLGEDTRTSSLTHPTRSAEQISMSKFMIGNSIFQCGGKSSLAYHRIKGSGTIFSCRYDVILHNLNI